jgi:hypothetical protein
VTLNTKTNQIKSYLNKENRNILFRCVSGIELVSLSSSVSGIELVSLSSIVSGIELVSLSSSVSGIELVSLSSSVSGIELVSLSSSVSGIELVSLSTIFRLEFGNVESFCFSFYLYINASKLI